jgi:hypothetical protein
LSSTGRSLGVLVFALGGLGLPGGVVLWPALHVLGARHAVCGEPPA